MVKYILFFAVFYGYNLKGFTQRNTDTSIVVVEDDSKIVKGDGSTNTMPDWIYIITSRSGVKFYLNHETLSNEDGLIKIWVKSLFKSYKWNKKLYYNCYLLTLTEFNLNNKTTKTFEIGLFSSNGSVIHTTRYSYPEEEAIFPNSIQEKLYKHVEYSINDTESEK